MKTALLKRFRAKWVPVRVKKTRQHKNPEQVCYSKKSKLVLAAVTACMLLAPPLTGPAGATSQGNRAGKTNSIVIQYVAPKNPAHHQIYERLREVRFLEKVQEFLAPFRLPRKLLFKTEGCDGDANAAYDDDEISICYEYIDEVLGFVPAETSPKGIAPIDALFGPLIDTCLHEFGHALFDMLKLPVFGREEDAADQVAAYITLQLGRDTARRLIGGTAHVYMSEALAEVGGGTPKLERFANEHGTPAQRFYNLLCLAYGADPEFSKGLVEKGYLPASRAEGCEDEYAQAERAYKTLIAPYVDSRMAKKVVNKNWLPPETTPVRVQPSQLIRRSSSE